MPPKKKSVTKKVSDKERMALRRAGRSEDQKAKENEANKVRMARKRKAMSDFEKEKYKLYNKERMAKKRAEKKMKAKADTPTQVKRNYIEHEREYNRLYRERVRARRSDVEHEYEMIYNLLCMRRLRKSLTDEEGEIDKAIARDRMAKARQEGFTMPNIRDRKSTRLNSSH